MIPDRRLPTHPREILLEEFLRPLGLTQGALAGHIGVPVQRVNEIISGKRGVRGCSPRVGRSREDLAPGLPSYPLEKCIVFSRVAESGVEIARILSGYRDIDALFGLYLARAVGE